MPLSNIFLNILAHTKRYRWLIFGWHYALGLSVALLLHFHGFGSTFVAVVIAVVFMPWIVGIGLVCGALWLWQRLPWAKWLSIGSVLAALFVVVQTIGIALLAPMAADSPDNLKANCELLRPVLDNYYAENNSYPRDLILLRGAKALPERFNETTGCYYRGHSSYYTFSVGDGWRGFWRYESTQAKWVRHAD